jgi:hypothetical protein
MVVYADGRIEPQVATIPVQKAAVQMMDLAMYLTGQPKPR